MSINTVNRKTDKWTNEQYHPRMDTASASSPTADGVTINYDAASLNQGAVLGTDYDYDFPNSTTVRVTSNAAQNLKVRVV